MTLMIRIYMTVCVMLLIFDVVFLLVKNMRRHQLYPRNKVFEARLQNEVRKYKAEGRFSEGFEEQLMKKLKKTKNLITLYSFMERHPNRASIFHTYIFAQMREYRRKSDQEQAYYTYVLASLNYKEKHMPADVASEYIKFLDSKSLYTFINTVEGFYKFGDTNTMLTVIDKIDERGGFYHKKLLVDGLLSVACDKEELSQKLEERFDRYSSHTQIALIDFFRMSGYNAAGLCMRVMKSNMEDKDVIYAAARYFVKYLNKEAATYFVSVLKKNDSDWVMQMIAIQAFDRFRNQQIRGLIKTKITSRNWHIRSNAVAYLHDAGMDKEEILQILSAKDKYTNEALLYEYRNDQEMSQFIANVIKVMEQNSIAASTEAKIAEGGMAG